MEIAEVAVAEITEVADSSFLGGAEERFRIASAGSMTIDTSLFEDVTRRILAAAIEVHRTVGPGLVESTYMPCFEHELIEEKLDFVRGRAVPIVYKGKSLGQTYFVDLFVEDKVVVEVKSVSTVLPVHHAQTLTYMRLLNAP